MKGKVIFLFIAAFGALAVFFSGSNTAGVKHGVCPMSRIAYIPASDGTPDDEAILIHHSHVHSNPGKAGNEPHRIRIRGWQRNFSIPWQNPASVKTSPVAAASLKAPPRYQAPHCLYPQHNYLFLLTPF